ncbi:hypothetical protein GYH30_015800 [Glycine max]|nr:hypothetical protein GYH30_015800 [Glycine max]
MVKCILDYSANTRNHTVVATTCIETLANSQHRISLSIDALPRSKTKMRRRGSVPPLDTSLIAIAASRRPTTPKRFNVVVDGIIKQREEERRKNKETGTTR